MIGGYTPGPWRVGVDGAGDIFISGADHSYIAEIGPCCEGRDMDDARLIAAAPELVEALRPLAKAADFADERMFERHLKADLPDDTFFAGNLTLGDLRAARALLARIEGANNEPPQANRPPFGPRRARPA